MLQFLLGDEVGRRTREQIDERVHRLPGLGGLHLVSRAAAAYGLAT